MASVEGLEDLKRRIARLSTGARDAMAGGVDKGADLFVGTVKSAAPIDETSPNPGHVRDSVTKIPGETPLFVLVEVLAKDAKGKLVGANIEHGHVAPDGTHVPAHPFFWPSYRLVKRRIKSNIGRGIGQAVRLERGGG